MPLLQWIPNLRKSFATTGETEREAIEFLERFAASRATDANAVGALILFAWSRAVSIRLFEDKLGEPLFNAIYGRRDLRAAQNLALTSKNEWWCDNARTAAVETCDDIVKVAWDSALADLVSRYGSVPSNWRWDTAHFARSEHRPFSNVPILKNLFEIRTPTAGDTYTVMVGKVRLREPDPFSNEFAASMRAVYDLSIPESTAATIIFSTGQSGNPFSAHYRDLAQRWGSAGPGAYIDLATPSVAGSLVLRGAS